VGPAGIFFRLASTERVVIAMYDVRGHLVRQLADDRLPGGEHVVTWDGRDAHGLLAPAGHYFARYQAGASTRTARIVRLE
jgi:flagellar hook assembly protein FlgD